MSYELSLLSRKKGRAGASGSRRNGVTCCLLSHSRLHRLVEQMLCSLHIMQRFCCMNKVLHPQSGLQQVPEQFGNIVLVTGGEIQTRHQILVFHNVVLCLLKVAVAKGRYLYCSPLPSARDPWDPSCCPGQDARSGCQPAEPCICPFCLSDILQHPFTLYNWKRWQTWKKALSC